MSDASGSNKLKFIAVGVCVAGALAGGLYALKKSPDGGDVDDHNHGGSNAHGHSHTRGTIRPVASVNQRGFTPADLATFNGVQDEKIYVSLKRKVYEVSPHFYGPGHDYHVFAGQEASRALAKGDLSGKELNKYWVDCSEQELATLEDYVETFESKYPVVGWYIPDSSFYDVKC